MIAVGILFKQKIIKPFQLIKKRLVNTRRFNVYTILSKKIRMADHLRLHQRWQLPRRF